MIIIFLTLNYYETDFKKTFPKKKGEILTELNCNSGSSHINKYLVFIWRIEEYKRVLFHELIHAFGGDKSLVFDNDVNSSLSNFFCLNDDQYINVNETYTETLATIFNLIFYTIENKKDIMDCFIKEFSYSLLLCVSILKHFSYNSINNLRKNE